MTSQGFGMCEKTELEQEARIALLQHYSAKSSNQVTNALTIALAFFAFVQTVETANSLFGSWTPTIIILILALFTALTVHTVYRVLYYGRLATYAQFSDFATPEILEKKEEELLIELCASKTKEKIQCSLNEYENFKRSRDAERVRQGLPSKRDYESTSFNMERLSIGFAISIDRNYGSYHGWQKFVAALGKSDQAIPALIIYFLFWGVFYIMQKSF